MVFKCGGSGGVLNSSKTFGKLLVLSPEEKLAGHTPSHLYMIFRTSMTPG